MTNDKSSKPEKKYDLEERTAKFGEDVIELCKKVPRNEITKPIISQLVRSATSVGANYCEADDAVSKKDFKNKIGICKKESRESKHHLRMLAKATSEFKVGIGVNWQEAKELNLIFNSIFRKIS
jgi:four helix bundle protein